MLQALDPVVFAFAELASQIGEGIVGLRLDNAMRKHTLAVYEMCQRNKSLTAKVLGINRRTLYRKLEKYEEK